MRGVATIVGLALLLGPPVVLLANRTPADVGRAPVDVEPAARLAAPARPVPSPGLLDSSPARSDREMIGSQSGLLARQSPSPRLQPSRLRVPAIGVDAAVVPVGVESDGQMEIPTDVREIGWYRHGPGPTDAAGSVVLAGHVDSRSQGPGAFFALQQLEEGAVIEILATDGTRAEYTVTGRRQYGKDEIPLAALFSREGPPRLVLMTCGGDFDDRRRRYADNVVVFAVPGPG